MPDLNLKENIEEIRRLIASDKLQEAISSLFLLLDQYSKKEERLKVQLAETRLEQVILRGDIRGMLSQETIIKERQKVIEALLSMLDGLEKQDYGRVIEGIKNIALLLAGAGAGKIADLILDKDPKFSSFTDPRDGKTYKTVKLIGKTWMAENLNYDVGEGSWYHDNNPVNGVKYGRLYTWEAAKRACPPGWRLPTDEEWKNLANSFGGYWDWEIGTDVGDPKKSYRALLEDGAGGFAALLGGARYPYGTFNNLGAFGLYWSGTEEDAQNAWYYDFYSDSGKLLRGGYDKAWGFSCRCLKDS